MTGFESRKGRIRSTDKKGVLNPGLELIRKYNVSGPRYTSYPTAVKFQEIKEVTGCTRSQLSGERGAAGPGSRPQSLYFHIPFCFSLCWFCGCTKIITRDTDRGDLYLDYLEKEMDLFFQARTDPVQESSSDKPEVIQVHFGGGTPTFLRPGQLIRLGKAIRSRFPLSENVEFSVEIDPRRCTREHIEALSEIGCNRASLGVQDTNPEVQKAIHRDQPFEVTSEVTRMLRECGITNLNFDLIYGLPRQTPSDFRKTIGDVMTLDPDRLAVYSYAHLPELFPAQTLLDESELPSSSMKLEMIRDAAELLPGMGMRFIGMDHFAREEDSLSLALDEGSLQRNFQGYSTCAESDMIAFGMSGITQFDRLYRQNSKVLEEYYRMLDERQLPVVKELYLTPDDRIRRDLIMNIMCRSSFQFQDFSDRWNIDFSGYFSEELEQLKEFERDGLLHRFPGRVEVTELGRFFLRNIAMTFDTGLNSDGSEMRYSKTV